MLATISADLSRLCGPFKGVPSFVAQFGSTSSTANQTKGTEELWRRLAKKLQTAHGLLWSTARTDGTCYFGVGAKFDTRRRTGPLALSLFGTLIGTHSPWPVAGGRPIAAALLLAVAAVESLYGTDAEGRSLEGIADPLSSG